jgi:hypothetical protein
MVKLNFRCIMPRVITFRFRKMRVIAGFVSRLFVYQYRFGFTKLFSQNSNYSVHKSPPFIDGRHCVPFHKVSLQYREFFFLWRCDPTRVMDSTFLSFSRSHTTTHHIR